MLNRLSKVHVERSLEKFVRRSTANYGRVKLILERGSFWIESVDKELLEVRSLGQQRIALLFFSYESLVSLVSLLFLEERFCVL